MITASRVSRDVSLVFVSRVNAAVLSRTTIQSGLRETRPRAGRSTDAVILTVLKKPSKCLSYRLSVSSIIARKVMGKFHDF